MLLLLILGIKLLLNLLHNPYKWLFCNLFTELFVPIILDFFLISFFLFNDSKIKPESIILKLITVFLIVTQGFFLLLFIVLWLFLLLFIFLFILFAPNWIFVLFEFWFIVLKLVESTGINGFFKRELKMEPFELLFKFFGILYLLWFFWFFL